MDFLSPRTNAIAAIATVATLASLTSACFNPSLGDMPFKCAPAGKRCPDNYVCAKQGTAAVCVPEGNSSGTPDLGNTDAITPFDGDRPATKDGAIYIDGSSYIPTPGCADESSEPNNTGATATTLPGQGTIPGWEICHSGDIDNYALQLSSGQKLVAKIIFKQSNGDLDMALLDPDGLVVRTSRTDTSDEKIEIIITKSGRYVLAVWGFDGAINTYTIDLSIS